MKKILSLFVLMAAFCMVGFAQSAPVTAKKATLMGNAQVKNVKTGEVLRVAKSTKTVPSNLNGTVQMSRTGTPTNSASPAGGSGAKKAVKGNNSNIRVIERYPNVEGRAGNPTNTVTKQKSAATKKVGAKTITNSLGKKQTRTPQNKAKDQRVVPQNAVILDKQ